MSNKHSTLDRRGFFSFAARGIGAAAFASLLAQEGVVRAAPLPGESHDPPPHHRAKARRVIHICLCGGLSQIDSFDYKPKLEALHGKALCGEEKPDVFFGKVGLLRKNDWEFKQRGDSGLWVSELFPHLAQVADELTVINSMFADSSSHRPATCQENSGFRLNGFPVLGSWLSYGLGSETDELPAYVVLPDARGMPAGTSANWTNGFLPARHQGVAFRTEGDPILDLFPNQEIAAGTERASRDLLAAMNREHLERVGGDVLQARMRSYAMAAKMQLAVPEVTRLDDEPESIREAYGLGGKETAPFGRNCLLARRLLEKGVRFVQLFSGGAFGSPRINWDGHEDMRRNHGREAPRIDQPVAALLKDLRQRGLLEDTLVLFTSEFGRTPFTQSAADRHRARS